jgi:hypothetical protein
MAVHRVGKRTLRVTGIEATRSHLFVRHSLPWKAGLADSRAAKCEATTRVAVATVTVQAVGRRPRTDGCKAMLAVGRTL